MTPTRRRAAGVLRRIEQARKSNRSLPLERVVTALEASRVPLSDVARAALAAWWALNDEEPPRLDEATSYQEQNTIGDQRVGWLARCQDALNAFYTTLE
jgi:hypothetical protein